MKQKKKVLLVGNPNVGKSTVFNEITGSHQHTGNWSGKTVELARGEYYYKFNDYELVDLPGTYSLLSTSEEERVARDYLCYERFDCVVCVVDATALERNLNLVLQVLELTDKAVMLLNLADEAEKKNIRIDLGMLSESLGIPVVRATARSGKGINELLEQIHLISNGIIENYAKPVVYDDTIEEAATLLEAPLKCTVDTSVNIRFFALRLLENNNSFNDSFRLEFGENVLEECPLNCAISQAKGYLDEQGMDNESFVREITSALLKNAGNLSRKAQSIMPSKKAIAEKRLDSLLLGKYTSVLSMLVIFGIVLWITIFASNYPSQLLRSLFDSFEAWCADSLLLAGVSETLVSLAVNGALRVLLWVVAVMLPPMAVFFPLFALLEDFGILPRIAFNLDGAFERCGACGKQALTTCMGYGCNAVGVTGCRIIDSPRERIVAVITNSLTPCNGRFPLLIAIITMFVSGSSIVKTVLLMVLLLLSLAVTFGVSKILTSTVLKGEKSAFVLELPPYRRPQILRLIGDTVREKILFVLLRAVVVAAPAGIVIWLLANVTVGDLSVLVRISQCLDPVGKIIGLDGVMLLAFILGFPANEIVIPIALMAYLCTGEMTDYSSLDGLKEILVSNGWTMTTAVCTCIFSMFHFPCSTTLLTIWRETKSLKWTVLSVFTPLAVGVSICAVINMIMR